ncbi:A24 family peptidase [Microbacterium sp. HA-8]|uniref:prepilin peptidase n=1 Tax=Microbacterium sp. HA-8 TaxID=3234200 RepID=UPI0038F7B41B
MTPAALVYTLVLAAVFGLVIGSFLNVVVYRVPAGIPLTRESRCPACDAPVRAWQNVPVLSWMLLRGRCATCRTAISARYPLVEVATALAFLGVVWAATERVAIAGVDASSIGVLLAYLWLAAVSVALTLIDLDTQRLPNAIVLPSYVVAFGLFAVAASLGADPMGLVRAAVGAAAMYGFYALLRLIRPDGMGGGDVKLAGVLGMYLGWVGWGALAVGGFAAFVLGGLYGVAVIIARRAGRRDAIPFGPWMLAGAWLGIAAGEPLAQAYVRWAIGA